jgi:hypothetical protein
MQSTQTYLSSSTKINKLPPSLVKPLNGNKAFLSYLESQESFQNKEMSADDIQSQAIHCLSLIKDPLWQHVCKDIINLMGPHCVLKIWDSRLGSFSASNQDIDIQCNTEDVAHFVQQYAFVILGSLQRYFPAIKDLQVKINYLSLDKESAV